MEEEEDGGDLLAVLRVQGSGRRRHGGTTAGSIVPAPPLGSQRKKLICPSQPLVRDGSGVAAGVGSGSRRDVMRKHGPEEEKIPWSRNSSNDNDCSVADDWDDENNGDLDGHGDFFVASNDQPRYLHSYSRSADETARYAQQHHHHPCNLPPPYHLQHFGKEGGGRGGGSIGGADVAFSLDRRVSSGGSCESSSLPKAPAVQGGSLSEFIGGGGGNGIFKVPLRAAVHPGRPPSLDLRPHPLRETQVGSFLRTISCTSTQLWAGQESGVRFWNFSDMYTGNGGGRILMRGDVETSPFRVSCLTPPTLCMVVDAASRLIWTGHKDGKIRSWKMDQPNRRCSASFDSSIPSPASSNSFSNTLRSFKEGFAWQAHRSPVLSLIITSYGDMWSGSEGGVIKVWPWEAIEKSLSLPMGERHMAALLVERSYIDLRSNVTIGGVCALPTIDIKYLLSDNLRAKVWSAGYMSFALWDSRTKELLKVFGIDGHVEPRLEMLPTHDSHIEDEIKIKLVSTSKKEKSQGSISFFQRSRNALIGAADAVRRAAAKSAFGEDNRRTEALTLSMDGTVWTGCTNGLIVQWDGNGNRVQEFQHKSSSVQCLCSFGSRIWVGYANGTLQVMDMEGNLLGGWIAHSAPVIKMAVGGNYIFTLANHGGIRGWNLMSPCPLDSIVRTELTNRKALYAKMEYIKILVGTWNVGQERASHDSLISWLGSAASEVGLVVVGLQEVEMGAGFLAMAAAKETVGLEGSANGQWWLETIGKTLDEGTSFERVGSRQLAGLLIAVWARRSLRAHIGDVDAAAVPCGFGRAIGNKGAVGLRMRIFDRTVCFVNCHFAAHLEAVHRRNADFDHVYRTMIFSRPSHGLNTSTAGTSSAVQVLRGPNALGVHSDDGRPELSEADMVVFLGDFNYRLHGITYDEARDFVSQRCFDWLRERDQLRAEMKAGRVFQGMREGQIKFPPTYKFERHQAGLSGYDSGEKKRIPAWCDRILYRDSRLISATDCSVECPVVSSISLYNACMDVVDSDHKPVRCIFNVDISHIDEVIKREEFGEIIMLDEKVRSFMEESYIVPETVVSTNDVVLNNQDITILQITNICKKQKVFFEITCEGQSSIKEGALMKGNHARGSFGFPPWLEVSPAAGVIKPGQTIEVSLQHEDLCTLEEFVDGSPRNWWCEDARDKEVILAVHITGDKSTKSICHRIQVRHGFSSKTFYDLKVSSQRVQSNLLRKSNLHHLNSSSDIDFGCIQGP